MFWKSENRLESKKEFFSKIEEHFSGLADGIIPEKIITELSKHLTDLLYESYKDCRKKYPKSKKRHSRLLIEDLNNPFYQPEYLTFLKIKQTRIILNLLVNY